ATPASSMSSSERCGVQLVTGGGSSPAFLSASTQGGGERWWWTSMRSGFACASIFPDMPAEAAAPSPTAATPPVTKLRRLIVASPSFTVAEARPPQRPHAAKNRRETPILRIGTSPAVVASPPRLIGDDVGTNRRAVKTIWKAHTGLQSGAAPLSWTALRR